MPGAPGIPRPQCSQLVQNGERSNTLQVRSGSIFVSRLVSKNLAKPQRECMRAVYLGLISG